MKLKLVFLGALITTLFFSCEKDKFTTIPQIKVKSITPGTVEQGDLITMQSKFTDEEGDLDSVYLILKWFDGNTVTREFDTLDYAFSNYGIPEKTRDGDLFVKFAFGQIGTGYPPLQGSPVLRDTTAAIGIVIMDKAKNRSEYQESDKIRLKKP